MNGYTDRLGNGSATLVLAVAASLVLPSAVRADLITYTDPVYDLYTLIVPGPGPFNLHSTVPGDYDLHHDTGVVRYWYEPWDNYIMSQAEAHVSAVLHPDLFDAVGSGTAWSTFGSPTLRSESSSFDVWVTLLSDTPFYIFGRSANYSITGGPSGPFSGNGSFGDVGVLQAGTYHISLFQGGNDQGITWFHARIGVPAPGAASLLGLAGALVTRRRR